MGNAEKKEDRVTGWSQEITTPIGRVSFNHLYVPDPHPQYGRGRYKVQLLYSKDTDFSKLKEAALEAARKAWGESATLDKVTLPFHDGDKLADEKGEEYRGKIMLPLESTRKPGLVGPEKNPDGRGFLPLSADRKIYGGCWGRARTVANAWEQAKEIVVIGADGKESKQKRTERGIKFYLVSFQFVRDDTPFGAGRASAETAFEDDLGGDIAMGLDDDII